MWHSWYCRNGEIVRVGNMSQGYAVAVLDLPIARTADVDHACEVANRVVVERAGADDQGQHYLQKSNLI